MPSSGPSAASVAASAASSAILQSEQPSARTPAAPSAALSAVASAQPSEALSPAKSLAQKGTLTVMRHSIRVDDILEDEYLSKLTELDLYHIGWPDYSTRKYDTPIIESDLPKQQITKLLNNIISKSPVMGSINHTNQQQQIDIIYCSPFRRCLQTAAAVIKDLNPKPSVIVDYRLGELPTEVSKNTTNNQHTYLSENDMKQILNINTFSVEENGIEYQNRTDWQHIDGYKTAILEIKNKTTDKNVLIIAHGHTVNTYIQMTKNNFNNTFYNESITLAEYCGWFMNEIDHSGLQNVLGGVLSQDFKKVNSQVEEMKSQVKNILRQSTLSAQPTAQPASPAQPASLAQPAKRDVPTKYNLDNFKNQLRNKTIDELQLKHSNTQKNISIQILMVCVNLSNDDYKNFIGAIDILINWKILLETDIKNIKIETIDINKNIDQNHTTYLGYFPKYFQQNKLNKKYNIIIFKGCGVLGEPIYKNLDEYLFENSDLVFIHSDLINFNNINKTNRTPGPELLVSTNKYQIIKKEIQNLINGILGKRYNYHLKYISTSEATASAVASAQPASALSAQLASAGSPAPTTSLGATILSGEDFTQHTCDKCDQNHSTESCPYYSQNRLENNNSMTAFGQNIAPKQFVISNNVYININETKTHKCPSDGNCGYHSLHYYYQNIYKNQLELRSAIIKYIKRNRVRILKLYPVYTTKIGLSDLSTKSDNILLDNIILELEKTKSWIFQAAIIFFGKLHNDYIYIFHKENKNSIHYKLLSLFEPDKHNPDSKDIYLLYNGNHYDVLILEESAKKKLHNLKVQAQEYVQSKLQQNALIV